MGMLLRRHYQKPLNDYTVKELKAMLGRKKIKYSDKDKKSDLIKKLK